jgi:hypothetical protein
MKFYNFKGKEVSSEAKERFAMKTLIEVSEKKVSPLRPM